jgi:hypothetical protein
MLRPLQTLRRPLLPAVALILLGINAAAAQPAFVLVDRKPVGRGPIFATTGDFNPGSPRGVAVSSFWVDEVTVFPTTSAGILAEPITLPLGRNLRDLTSFDLDGDSFGDLVVGDEAGGSRDARLFTLLGTGNNFQAPNEIIIETSLIESLRTGNFDGTSARDIATANGRLGTVSIIYGRDGQLLPAANVFLAGSVTDVAALDVDGDGLDDLIVLTTDDADESSVTVLRSQAIGFVAQPPTIQLGMSGVRMTKGDYDADGVLDLAVIGGGPTLTQYSVRVLLTRRPLPAPGAPAFTLQSQTFDCPAGSGQDPSRCRLLDVVSADFDRNGLFDLAISIPDPGTVAIAARQTGGSFAAPTYVGVAGSPRGLAAGDISGDGVEDLVITEFDADMVTVAVSVVPPRRELGEPCADGIECETGACVDDVCCLELQCASAERCDITGHRGTCTRPLPAGSDCDKDTDCRSHMCSATAPATGFCLPGGTSCLGDCNRDGSVTVDEIVLITQIALGVAGVEACPAADGSGDGQITVEEIIGAVDSALDGCAIP